VHHTSLPEVRREYLDDSLHERWEKIWEIRAIVTKALEEARRDKVIGLSLDAQVNLHVPEKLFSFFECYERDLKSIFIVSSVTLRLAKDEKELRAEVLRADGEKCERCWNYDVTVGQHPEHQAICGRCVEAIKG
jgi:isoleucyl-tRNA synthetase